MECDSAVEGSDDERGEAGDPPDAGLLFLQRTEGVLHVLHQLGVVGLDLGLAVLHWVLQRHGDTHSLTHVAGGSRRSWCVDITTSETEYIIYKKSNRKILQVSQAANKQKQNTAREFLRDEIS